MSNTYILPSLPLLSRKIIIWSFSKDWIKILNINIIQVILCPFQGIIYSGTCDVHLPSIVDVNFDLLAKLVLLHDHVVTIFSLAAKKQSVRRYFSTMHIPCSSSKLSPLDLSSLVILEWTSLTVISKCWFWNSTSLHINHLSAFLLNQELSFPLITCSFVYNQYTLIDFHFAQCFWNHYNTPLNYFNGQNVQDLAFVNPWSWL